MVSSIVYYFDSMNLVDSPLQIITLILACGAGLIALFSHLSSVLCRAEVDPNTPQSRNILHAAETVGFPALIAGVFTIPALLLTLARWLVPCPCVVLDALGIPFCALTNTLTPLFVGTVLVGVTVLGAIGGAAMVRRDIKYCRETSEVICAAVLFKGGRRIRGGIKSLSFLRGDPYFKFMLDAGREVDIETTGIAGLYLQKDRIGDLALDSSEFNEGPKHLYLKANPNEIFEYARYYDRSGLRIFRCYKRDTGTDYVIAPRDEVAEKRPS
ncbi:hypothetical protein GF356_07500 [candidate division GN15 bacterium]|nr:hypothetical protein [candidate division GN15 bacterium]